MSAEDCKLCRFVRQTAGEEIAAIPGEIQPVAIGGDEHWIVVLNENQATLGRVYIVLRRHETDVARLGRAEQESLFRHLAAVQGALSRLFAPDHYNQMFLMNLVRHAHFHIYPRYAAPRTFAGDAFTDGRYGAHFDPAEVRRLSDDVRDALAAALRGELTAD